LAPGEARRRDAAATRIQRIWRGGAGRSVATDRWVAVFQIQRFWRGALGRRRARAAQREKKARDEAEARAEEIDDITASVRARRERRTPGRPPGVRRRTTMLSLRKIPTLARAVHPEENHRLGRGAHRRRGGRRRAISERRERRAVRGLGVFRDGASGRRGSASRGKPRENSRERPQPD
jgi:hypothetical protein